MSPHLRGGLKSQTPDRLHRMSYQAADILICHRTKSFTCQKCRVRF
uniref:Uncharacterized protein n=1 Tax=Anguilla anguilla TaxID=7936 RepID=A0A0E9Q6S6_ANGAN